MSAISKTKEATGSHSGRKRSNYEGQETAKAKLHFEDYSNDKNGHRCKFDEICEPRLKELSASLINVFAAIKDDDLLSTMLDDNTSKGFAQHRIREIIEGCLDNDREDLIKHLYKQNALLEENYSSLNEEYAKVFHEQKEMVLDFNNKMHEMEREKKALEEKVNRLQNNIDELTEEYQQTLKNKETEMEKKIEEDLTQLHVITNKIKEVESRFKESDRKCKEFSQKCSALQNEVELQKDRNRDLELKLQTTEAKIVEGNKAITNYEALQKELETELEQLAEENKHLKYNLSLIEDGKKGFEDDFKNKIQEIEKAIQNERETYRKNVEQLQKNHETKVKKYKAKILEYKEKYNEKEKELEESLKKSGEAQVVYSANVELLKQTIEEEKEFSDKRILELEESHRNQINEVQIKCDEQLQQLENHFETLFNEKVEQIQEEAFQLKKLLDEKTKQMEKEYIKLSDHEEILKEKNNLIRRLNQEIIDKDYSSSAESSSKLKDLEKHLAEEFDVRQATHKRTISDLENQISELRSQKKRVEASLSKMEEENTSLKKEIEEFTSQKKKLLETTEEWISKNRSLNNLYKEEKDRRIDLEERMTEYHLKFDDIRRKLEILASESAEKDIQVGKLTDQLSILERTLVDKEHHCNSLESQLETLEAQYRKSEEELQDSKRLEAENLVKCTEAEEKVKTLMVEINDSEMDRKRFQTQIETLNEQSIDLTTKFSKLESNYAKVSKEKTNIQKDLEKALLKVKELKQSKHISVKAVTTKLESLKTGLKEIKIYYKSTIARLVKENEVKVLDLVKEFSKIVTKNEELHQAESENIKIQLQNNFNYNYEGLKEKYSRLQKDMAEIYEQKCLEKERNIRQLQEAQRKLSDKNTNLELEIERIEVKYSRILKEKEELAQTFEIQMHNFINEINDFNETLKKSSRDFNKEKFIAKEEHKSQMNFFESEINGLKEKHKNALLKYTKQIDELSKKHEEEITMLQTKYKEVSQKLEKVTSELKAREQELTTKGLSTAEKIASLEKRNQDLEEELLILREKEDIYLNEYEKKMEELRDAIEKENRRMNNFKEEKFNEIAQQKSKIYMLEKEISIMETKMNDLLEEKDEISKKLKIFLAQNEPHEIRSPKKQQEIMDFSPLKNKETKKLSNLLSSNSSRSQKSSNFPTAKKFERENIIREDTSKLLGNSFGEHDIRFTFNQDQQENNGESSPPFHKKYYQTDTKVQKRNRLTLNDFTS